MNRIRNISIMLLLICFVSCGGCRLLESAVGDVGGWDISACISGFDVCWELYWDNINKFEGGFVKAVDALN